MKQGLLAFQYEQEKGSTDMTGLSGLMTYVELMDAAGLRSSVERHVRLRKCGQGWTDSQIITSLIPHFPYQPCRACRNQQQNYPM